MGLGDNADNGFIEPGSLGPKLGPQSLERVPLLPYERQLIDALGCSEDEYREYKRELTARAVKRGEEYAHIPEVNNDITTIIVSLVVGVLSTAASILLAPKPPQPQQQKERQSLNLGDDIGATRFNKSTQFGSVQEIANLGDVIPIMFGRYDEENKTGGLSMSPPLIWSRMFSFGTHQSFKALYTFGEALGPNYKAPDLKGIRFGTTSVQGVPEKMVTLLFKPQGDRPNNNDIYFGSRGNKEDPDPTGGSDVYKAPVEGDSVEEAFSHTYTPSSDTDFGCHSAIRNGTPYKLNWRIVNIPKISGDDDPDDRLKAERQKIAGSSLARGTGREYGVFMGAYQYISNSGRVVNARDDRVKLIEGVDVGDQLKFIIKKNKMTDKNANVDNEDIKFSDVRGSVDQLRVQADDALQIGEQFMIGRTIWQVLDRDNFYEEGRDTATITLRCTELTTVKSAAKVGLVSQRALDKYAVSESKANYSESLGYVDPDFYPLCRYALASIRNVRPCDSTEFGIRSNVWLQAQGITNFADLPDWQEQEEYDEDHVQVTEGRVQRYLKRTSIFTIFIRPVDSLQEDKGWQPLGEQYIVTGESNMDIYNYIRVSHQRLNGRPRQFEYRFIPKNSADLRNTPLGENMIQLRFKEAGEIRKTYQTVYGPVTVVTTGKEIPFTEDLWYHEQFYEAGSQPEYGYQQIASGVELIEWRSDPNTGFGRHASFTYEILGDPKEYRGRKNSGTFKMEKVGNGEVTVKLTGESRKVEGDDARDYINKFNTEWRWESLVFSVEKSEGDVQEDIDTYWIEPSSDNYFAKKSGIREIGARLKVRVEFRWELVKEGIPTRDWAKKSQIQEVQFYDELISSCDSGSEHAITYVTEAIANNSDVKYSRLALFGAMVRSSSSLQQIDQIRVWMPDGIDVRRWEEDGEIYGPSNLFSNAAYFLLSDEITGVGRLANWGWIDEDSFRRTARYLRANKIHFDSVITEKQNIRSYLSEVAPFNLCNFVIRNGAFGMEPALPTDSTGKISDSIAVQPKALFTSGNVIDGSFTVNYLEYSERQDFRAVVIYREIDKYGLPQKRSIMLRWTDEFENTVGAAFPQEEFDISNFCSSRAQAKMTGQFLMSIRRRIDHTISFQTSPLDLDLAPGDYIKIARVDAPTSYLVPVGVISSDNGAILSADPLDDGEHEVDIYLPGSQDISRATISVENNQVADESFWGSVFSAFNPRPNQAIYQVEQLTITDEGLVEITAVHYPTDDAGASIIAKETLSTSAFTEID